MVKEKHTRNGAHTAAQNGGEEQRLLGDAPGVPFCSGLIHTHEDKSRQIDRRQPDRRHQKQHLFHSSHLLSTKLPKSIPLPEKSDKQISLTYVENLCKMWKTPCGPSGAAEKNPFQREQMEVKYD